MLKFLLSRIDFTLLTPALLLVGLALATLYSIDIALFQNFLLFSGVSLVAFLVFTTIDFHIFDHYYKYLYIGMILLLAIVFVIGIEARGAVRWIEIGSFRLQLSEVIKPFFIIFIASLLSRTESRSILKLLFILVVVFPIFFLTLKQPDLGNAIIFLLASSGMIFVYGFPLLYFVALGIISIIPLPFLYNFLHDYQKQRIVSFLNYTHDPSGTSYNIIQALISIGSGGFLGKGFGESTQSVLRFLPERHTDFIFSTITESLGFVGGMVIIGIYTFLMYRIYVIAKNTESDYLRLIAVGFFFLFLIHTFFNIGMNVGIVPIVGITLPFLSYGGSSLLTNFIILGMASSISKDIKEKKTLYEIR